MNEQTQEPLVDCIVEAYVAWREESLGVWDAYAVWATAEATDRRGAFLAYRATLDREEYASLVYEDSIVRVKAASQTHGGTPVSQVAEPPMEQAPSPGFAKLIALSPGFARIVQRDD